MTRRGPSLLTKILGWFFLNLALVVVVLGVFFAFQPQINLHAIIGQEGSNRMRSTGMVISHDLHQTPRADWSQGLARHATIHKVDFVLLLENGSRFTSTDMDVPEEVVNRVKKALKHKPPPRRLPPPLEFDRPQKGPDNRTTEDDHGLPGNGHFRRPPPMHADPVYDRPHFMMRTRHPTRYWSGMRIPLPPEPFHPPAPGVLLAVSNSATGNGFFFDPVPWIIVAAAIILISALLWIPMVRYITRPLTRMTLATEEIAKGRFDVAIGAERSDEIGRLARTINLMAERLSGFVNGQKRFLGDVAHELGSPIARIQFGLGTLEQRTDGENRQRVVDVLEDVEHLSKLVNELLAFSRADLKSKTVQLEQIDLLPVVQSAIKRETTPEARIIVQIDPGLRVLASAELLTRAVANLLRNALKYAADNGPIEVAAEEINGFVEIEVRDHGPGVSENLLDQLFEPFFRPEPSRDRDSGGVGLGLAIVKTCVETCQGTVTAANLQPIGFSVKITLSS